MNVTIIIVTDEVSGNLINVMMSVNKVLLMLHTTSLDWDHMPLVGVNVQWNLAMSVSGCAPVAVGTLLALDLAVPWKNNGLSSSTLDTHQLALGQQQRLGTLVYRF